MRKHVCRNCLYLNACYGWRRDNKGNRKPGNYFCSNPNCGRTLKDFPNKCQYKIEESEKKTACCLKGGFNEKDTDFI